MRRRLARLLLTAVLALIVSAAAAADGSQTPQAQAGFGQSWKRVCAIAVPISPRAARRS